MSGSEWPPAFARAAADRLAQRMQRSQRSPRTIRRAARLLEGRMGNLERSDVEAIQLRRLRALLAHVERASPFYRRRLAEGGLSAGRLRDLDDLRGLAPTTSTDLRDRLDEIRAIDCESIAASFESAGTTGAPKRIDFSFGDVQALANVGAATLRLRYGDVPVRAAVAMPLRHGLWVGWRQATWILERAGALALPLGDDDPDAVAEAMLRYRTDTLLSSPSFARRLAETFGCGDRPPLSRIVLGAEKLEAEDAAVLDEAFPGAAVHSSYATTELGVGLASSWRNEAAIIVNETEVIVEIVDAETGEPADEGDLLFTTLGRRGTPLLRYPAGDRVRRADHGGPYPFLAFEPLGRDDEFVVIAGSNVSVHAVAEVVRAIAHGGTAKTQLRLERVDGRQRLVVRVDGAIDGDRLARRLLEAVPRLRDHVETGEIEIETEANADLGDQLKSVAVKTRA